MPCLDLANVGRAAAPCARALARGHCAELRGPERRGGAPREAERRGGAAERRGGPTPASPAFSSSFDHERGTNRTVFGTHKKKRLTSSYERYVDIYTTWDLFTWYTENGPLVVALLICF